MPRRVGFRLLFIIAVALAASAIGDALVETVSNTGIVGRGYSDTNHLSVVPTFIAGASIAVLLACCRCLELFRLAGKRRGWLLEMAADIASGSPLQDVPWVLVLQLAALFAMESIEQLLFGGRLLGGLVWLGGPLWFSVITHVLLAIACTTVVTLFMRSVVAHCASIVSSALQFLLDVSTSAGVFTHRRDNGNRCYAPAVHVHQIGERAPPLLATRFEFQRP